MVGSRVPGAWGAVQCMSALPELARDHIHVTQELLPSSQCRQSSSSQTPLVENASSIFILVSHPRRPAIPHTELLQVPYCVLDASSQLEAEFLLSNSTLSFIPQAGFQVGGVAHGEKMNH